MPISKSLCSCPYCGVAFKIFDELKTHIIAVHKTDPLPKPDGLLHLTMNGMRYEIMVEPEWTLYYLLHDKLGFTGTKLFCDRGVCGSCTVIIDSRPALSCMTLAVECDGKTIETIEGIAASNHPLIEEYVSHHAMQCGYCTPGFVVTAKALLDRNPFPTEEQAREALAGHICRCGTYPQHPKAVLAASKRLSRNKER